MLRKIVDTLKLITVEPYMFFTALGVSTQMVSFQSLLMDRACRNTLEYPDDICDDMDNHKMEQENSIEVGNNLFTGIMLVSSIPAVVVVTFLGPWSDKYSRKWPMMMAISGILAESLAIVFLTINKSVPPVCYVIASLLSGVTGGFLVCMSAGSSYLSDVTEERSRSTRFAIMNFFAISATVFGSVLGGQIFKAYGYLTVLSIPPCLHFCAFLYAVLILKETKPPVPAEKRGEMFRDLFRLDNIKQSYYTCTKKRHGNIRLQIWLLFFVDSSVKFAGFGTMSLAFAYAKQMYKMGVTEFSNASSVFSIVNALMMVLVVPLLTKKFRLHEAVLGFIGMLSLLSKLVLSSVAYTLPMFYYAMISGTLLNCTGIAIQSRLSKLVPKEEIGRAFSLLETFSAFAPMLGTAAFVQVYNASLNFFPGLAYAVACVLLLPSAVILWWMTKLPSISLGEFARDDEYRSAKPLETISSPYKKLEEAGCSYK